MNELKPYISRMLNKEHMMSMSKKQLEKMPTNVQEQLVSEKLLNIMYPLWKTFRLTLEM